MAIAPETSIHGRMRQRIVAISSTRASRRHVVRDRYLHRLVHSGVITQDGLNSAIDGCNNALSQFTWLIGIDDAVLGRADCVFLVNHGRFPVEDSDFRLNGAYYRICRSLQHDPHYYDPQLEQFPQALQAQQSITPHAIRMEPFAGAGTGARRGNAWAFVGVLAIGFVTVPILATILVRWFPQATVTAGLSIGGVWLCLLLGALALTLPRRRG